MIHQPSLERALRQKLTAFPNAELRSSWRFTGYQDRQDHFAVAFSTPEGDVGVKARYLVGADGSRSPVRAAAGIDVDDLNFDEPWLVIDAIVHDSSRLPDINLQICDPARPTTCVLMGEGRHRWEFMIKPGETPEDFLDDAFIKNLLAPWNVEGAVTLERKAVYRFNAKVALQWRKGRVLLAGDAAHQMPPFAGQGLCSGTRDAANLAWKLAAVVNGGSDALLDTYQPEREPNVRAITGMAIMMGRTVCITDPAAATARNVQMLAARAAGSSPDGGVSYPPIAEGFILKGSAGAGAYFPQPCTNDPKPSRLDDVLGMGAWLLTTGPFAECGTSGIRIATLADPELAPFAATLAAWLTTHNADAVLVRPDRYVFGTGTPSALLDAWAQGAA